MPRDPFKLSQSLYGHSLDVRAVTTNSYNNILSGSRDQTAKLWIYDIKSRTYEERQCFRGHKSFIQCVIYLNSNTVFPKGLIITGGNDSLIQIFEPDDSKPIFTIKEHSDTVCCLNKTEEQNSFLVGSWDKTAKYFKITDGHPHCVTTFIGHDAAIWSVLQLRNGQVVTASADNSIRQWELDGKHIRTLVGHTECVRSLIDINESSYFVSVGNDASLRFWTYAGENIRTLYGHTSYIYQIVRCPTYGPTCFVTCGEDMTLRIWEDFENTFTITLPAQSVWSVACLMNGDIVAGSSDGVVRVFTREESRYADETTLQKFDEDVANYIKQQSQNIGSVKSSDLPGPEGLYEPGRSSGQTKMIREDGKVIAYKWVSDGDNSHWDKIGEVMGGTDKDSSGKTIFEGKAYDFVFNVDVEDGKPPLKLAYNKGDDVYQTANNFLIKNMLPPDYLEQIVDYILKNSQEKFTPPSQQYEDPFTGGNRYTPSYDNNARSTEMNVDPFTGGNSYTTSSSKPSTSTKPPTSGGDPFTSGSSYSTAYFPVTSYRTFDTGDPKIIVGKIKEFNENLSHDKLPAEDLDKLIKLCSEPADSPEVYEMLFTLLNWPENIIFPVLDVIRMTLRDQTNNEIIVSFNNGEIIEKLKKYININCGVMNNTIVALRAICNLVCHEAGENLLFKHRFDIIEHLTTLLNLNTNAQIAMSTVLFNLTLLIVKKRDDLGFSVLAQILPDGIMKLSDPESHFRIYVALGTLLVNLDPQKPEILDGILRYGPFLKTLELHGSNSNNDLENKRRNCARQLIPLL
ncbi:hypothetical protein ABEB36_003380 [Hypothenemus hampei]|uniref:Phospholipase A-2-activating protein n=1 Tax=Hypothenemus hampei TaxID=57062 RepID=A0ABD1FBK4_HYPHA